MKITKISMSELTKLQYITLREFGEYIVLSMPLDCSLEVTDLNINIRKKVGKDLK